MYTLGDRLKELRLSKGLSLRELADICETSKSAIHMYEVGKRKPKIEVLEAFSDTFNVDIDYLLGKTDIKNSVAEQFGYSSLEEAYNAGALGSLPLYNLSLSEGELELIELFRKIPEDQQSLVLSMIRAAVGNK